jgi:hypothetical protein
MVRAKFLSAVDGAVVLTLQNGRQITLKSAEDVAFLADLVDFRHALVSSSMDYADEYGFEHATGAWSMLNRGLEMNNDR